MRSSRTKSSFGGMIRRGAQVAIRSVVALFFLVWDSTRVDVMRIWHESRLFLGAALVVVGLLSFEAKRFCDGVSTGIGCTRPSAYYEYPLWAIVLVLAGTFFLLLWWLYRR